MKSRGAARGSDPEGGCLGQPASQAAGQFRPGVQLPLVGNGREPDVLRFRDTWTWDFWLAVDGNGGDERHHAFFLQAPKSLRDPNLRHAHATIGHAVSTDLRTWTRTIGVPSGSGLFDGPRENAFDDLAQWTGSTVRDPQMLWRTYYTGISGAEGGLVQRVGMATSSDLLSWKKLPEFATLCADGRWYEKLGESFWPHEAWRDPWVFADPGGGWHMIVTARANSGDPQERGVLGHLHSVDLTHWETLPPLTAPGAGFGVLEVPQIHEIDGRTVLIFSCADEDLAPRRRAGTLLSIVNWIVRVLLLSWCTGLIGLVSVVVGMICLPWFVVRVLHSMSRSDNESEGRDWL